MAGASTYRQVLRMSYQLLLPLFRNNYARLSLVDEVYARQPNAAKKR